MKFRDVRDAEKIKNDLLGIQLYNSKSKHRLSNVFMTNPLPGHKACSLRLLQRTTIPAFSNGSAVINWGRPLDEKALV